MCLSRKWKRIKMLVDEILKTALEYADRGYSIIPVQHNKKPFIKWTRYQTEKADPDRIRRWFEKWPDANIGIVTGEISGITVLDPDTQTGIGALNELIPEHLTTPVANTPKGGQHYYFKYEPGLPNKSRILTDTDIRNDGGYVVAVPGSNGNGKNYAWVEGLSLDEVEPARMPAKLLDEMRACKADSRPHFKGVENIEKKECIIENVCLLGEEDKNSDNKRQQMTTFDNISFNEGQRDESLFHVANCLIRGGMKDANLLNCLKFIGSNCNPPFPEKEIQTKYESALKRTKNQNRNLTADIRDLIMTTSGNITTTFVHQMTTSITLPEKKKVNVIMGRLEKEGLLERTGRIAGEYRKVEGDCDEMDFLKADSKVLDLWLPFQLDDLVEIMPGNVILVAGSPDSGKTALLLNMIHENMNKFNIHYFNSEMGGGELKKRLGKFDYTSLDKWNFKAYERSSNFGDVIKPGEGVINIIDFLEIYESFYEVALRVYEIWKKLNGAIAIIALQKNPGVKVGLGGYRGMEKPRLYLSMDKGSITIAKAKNWKTMKNPNDLQYKFNIIDGCKFIQNGRLGWHKPVKIDEQ